MESESKQSLFQVYLRLRPPQQVRSSNAPREPWLLVESPAENDEARNGSSTASATHVMLQPPNDSRKRAVERFGFTKVFEQDASQLEIFEEAGTVRIVDSVLRHGRDGLVATLGVTGSGKSHTILGSKTQRGLTQMSLDTVFRSIGSRIRRIDHPDLPTDHALLEKLQTVDSSEAIVTSATTFLDNIYGDADRGRHSRAQTPMTGGFSRAQTPMTVRHPVPTFPGSFPMSPRNSGLHPSAFHTLLNPCPKASSYQDRPKRTVTPTVRPLAQDQQMILPSQLPFWNRDSFVYKNRSTKPKASKETQTSTNRRPMYLRPSTLPQVPDVSHHAVEMDQSTDYVVIVSMYEVYNDRIFDLLNLSMLPNGNQSTTRQGTLLQKDLRRRPLLFKSTELSPDRKVVAGLRKVVCGSYEEAMMVLEAGLTERRVAGTGSNSVSSRSHGFFCIEIKKNSAPKRYDGGCWTGGTLSIVDLAGSERARSAKTTGSTLAEAGKINESLMYLGQCLQLQSDYQSDKPTIVPYRQCKLTELLFSNSFPSVASHSSYRTPQKATMIVTADPEGDFNATSQILRYSALAREVTVPRVPSTTSQLLSSTISRAHQTASGRNTPQSEELELAVHEIARLSEDNDLLTIRLAEEEIKVTEMSIALRAAEDKAFAIEAEVREECWSEMEMRIEEEKSRYRQAWEKQKSMGEEYVDGKIDILGRGGIAIAEDETATSADDRMAMVERENDMLRTKLASLEREIQGRSPTKKSKSQLQSPSKRSMSKPLSRRQSGDNSNPRIESFRDIAIFPADTKGLLGKTATSGLSLSPIDTSPLRLGLDDLRLTGDSIAMQPKTPATVKKQRKLTTRKWDLADEADLFD